MKTKVSWENRIHARYILMDFCNFAMGRDLNKTHFHVLYY